MNVERIKALSPAARLAIGLGFCSLSITAGAVGLTEAMSVPHLEITRYGAELHGDGSRQDHYARAIADARGLAAAGAAASLLCGLTAWRLLNNNYHK